MAHTSEQPMTKFTRYYVFIELRQRQCVRYVISKHLTNKIIIISCFILHPVSVQYTNISQRAEGRRADIGRENVLLLSIHQIAALPG